MGFEERVCSSARLEAYLLSFKKHFEFAVLAVCWCGAV